MNPIVTFADVAHNGVSFDSNFEWHKVVLELIDSKWFQRLRDISQTANTRLLYMFSEHSRFGHSIGVAYLANQLMDNLFLKHPNEIKKYRIAVSAAALLHDIGHLAPGSHTAFKTWFPDSEDCHEAIATKIILEDSEINSILSSYDKDLPHIVSKILNESSDIPPWTWEIISGGGWNVDRGNWCLVDSIMAGVSYGKYNISALTESIVISDDKHLAFQENRLDTMMHFALSRHAMYRQVYQHRVLLAADTLNIAIARRAKFLNKDLNFCDQVMQQVLKANNAEELTLKTIFDMRESWWRYHLLQWKDSNDLILADLSNRMLHRKLFKTIRIHETDSFDNLKKFAINELNKFGLDPNYYLFEIETSNFNESDYRQSMMVIMEDGRLRHLADAEPLFGAMAKESGVLRKKWLVVPKEVKILMGRAR
jgi:HD superfamily phosphohydrolase